MTFNIFTGEHKHKLTRGERAEWTQYLWPLLNASAMTASARLARHIEFRVRRKRAWNLRSAFFAAPPPSFFSFGEWHIRLTDVTLLRRSLNRLSKGWDVGRGLGRADGSWRGRRRWRGCTSELYLPGRMSLWIFIYYYFFLPISLPKRDSSHYGWLGSSLH